MANIQEQGTGERIESSSKEDHTNGSSSGPGHRYSNIDTTGKDNTFGDDVKQGDQINVNVPITMGKTQSEEGKSNISRTETLSEEGTTQRLSPPQPAPQPTNNLSVPAFQTADAPSSRGSSSHTETPAGSVELVDPKGISKPTTFANDDANGRVTGLQHELSMDVTGSDARHINEQPESLRGWLRRHLRCFERKTARRSRDGDEGVRPMHGCIWF